MPLAVETNAGVARLLMDIEFHELGLDYLRRYPEIIRALTKDDLHRAAQRWIDPERFSIVVAGPQLG
jgi:zinc protease